MTSSPARAYVCSIGPVWALARYVSTFHFQRLFRKIAEAVSRHVRKLSFSRRNRVHPENSKRKRVSTSSFLIAPSCSFETSYATSLPLCNVVGKISPTWALVRYVVRRGLLDDRLVLKGLVFLLIGRVIKPIYYYRYDTVEK